MRCIIPLCLFALTPSILPAQDTAAVEQEDQQAVELNGIVENGFYVSPTGLFSIEIPVLEALGGSASDTKNVVTFEDSFGTHLTIAAFPMDDTLRAGLAKQGKKDFLVGFFAQAIMPGLRQNNPEVAVEDAKFLGATQGGALLIMTVLPRGSNFYNRIALFGRGDPIPDAKRGNLLFVHKDHIIIVSSELAERVTERTLYTLTKDQEQGLMRARLLKLLGTMQLK